MIGEGKNDFGFAEKPQGSIPYEVVSVFLELREPKDLNSKKFEDAKALVSFYMSVCKEIITVCEALSGDSNTEKQSEVTHEQHELPTVALSRITEDERKQLCEVVREIKQLLELITFQKEGKSTSLMKRQKEIDNVWPQLEQLLQKLRDLSTTPRQ
jgi:hypothetical protein